MKKIIYIFLFFIVATHYGQTITPQVINSAGGNWQLSNGITLSDNIGEPFVSTITNGNNIITQGFLQSFSVARIFSVSVANNNVSCKDKNDGNISIGITTSQPSVIVQYSWTPSSVCPGGNCSAVDSLKPGTYTVVTTINYTVGTSLFDTVFVNRITITDVNGPCKVKMYSGITANGDGNNDVFTIDNITEFPRNRIMIYNRWGQLLYEETGYDNETKSWPRKDGRDNIISGTYFYILYLEENSNPIKGWVELIKN